MTGGPPPTPGPSEGGEPWRGGESTGFALRAELDRGSGRLCLWLAGEIDAAERDLVVAELDRGEPTEITIDMRAVRYIGSAGLSALIHACRRLEPLDRKVVLFNPSAPVIRLLDTCGLTRHFSLDLS